MAPDSFTPGSEGSPTVALIARWKAGDEAAFKALHLRFAPLLAMRVRRSRIWPLLVGQFQVEDIVQEIWAKVISAVGRSFEPTGSGSFLSFLATIADRSMITLARRTRAQKRGDGQVTRALDGVGGEAAWLRPECSQAETPTSRARVSELEEIAMQVLADREYQAWDLVELAGYTADEAGLAMQRTGSAVRGLLLRGRSKLVVRLGSKSGYCE